MAGIRKVLRICGCMTLLVLLLVMACEEEEDMERVSISPITHVDLPGTASLNQSVTFSTQYLLFNGSGKFRRSETRVSGDTVTITYFGIYVFKAGIEYTTDVRTLNRQYTF